jgi:hypothetical protein
MHLIKFEPIFDIAENNLSGIGDRKIGEEIDFISDFKVVEKTKNFVVLRVNFSFMTPSRRVF